jgi:tetratricopeptide (TPR) repeat protein
VALNERGRKADARGDHNAAEALYRQAIDADASYGAAWFNLGLVYKFQRRWTECFDANRRAAAIDGGRDEPAWWNLGIAATAIRDWATAREAWKEYGITLPDGTGVIDAKMGLTPVRLNPDKEGEVVWATRLDPARARIESVPLPASQHHWGDIVLHDGAPNGEREWHGRSYSVFDELERWEPSPIPTLVLQTSCLSRLDSLELEEDFAKTGFAAEDWTQGIRMLCKACSEGRPHDEHQPGSVPWSPERQIGVGAPMMEAEKVIREWARRDPSRVVGTLVMAF